VADARGGVRHGFIQDVVDYGRGDILALQHLLGYQLVAVAPIEDHLCDTQPQPNTALEPTATAP
jgi:hypothetical protein